MFHTKTKKDAVLHRLKIARGHLEKVISMVDKDVYFLDILNQSRAVQQAIQGADKALLENHVESSVADYMRKGQVDKGLKEVLQIIRQK